MFTWTRSQRKGAAVLAVELCGGVCVCNSTFQLVTAVTKYGPR